MKQEDTSNCGTEFHLGVWKLRSECGQIWVSVRGGEEFIDGEIGWSIGGKENVGYVV